MSAQNGATTLFDYQEVTLILTGAGTITINPPASLPVETEETSVWDFLLGAVLSQLQGSPELGVVSFKSEASD
jgi:hypothetical protein|eukprot:COSAG06_NODE_3605_length_5130_cov_14.426953_3_plen_73_part_00